MTKSPRDEPSTLRLLFVSAVMELWQKGFDTQFIAKTLREDQALVERALHEGINMRRKAARQAENAAKSAT